MKSLEPSGPQSKFQADSSSPQRGPLSPLPPPGPPLPPPPPSPGGGGGGGPTVVQGAQVAAALRFPSHSGCSDGVKLTSTPSMSTETLSPQRQKRQLVCTQPKPAAQA